MASAYLTRTPSSSGNRKTFTFSFWVKRSGLGFGTFYSQYNSSSNNLNSSFYFDGQDNLIFWNYNSAYTVNVETNRVFRDTNAWYHIVLSVDTTQSTASNRVKMYVNGVQETSFSSSTYPSQNLDLFVNENKTQQIGIFRYASDNYYLFDGYMTHYHFIDGTALTPTSFGESDSNGVWKPKTSPSVTYGTNGFFLKMDNSGNMGLDSSGNSNNFTTNGTITQAKDTPSNVFATWNSLFRKGTSTPAFSNGSLTSTFDDAGANEFALTTLGASSGKYYAEIKWVSATGTGATSTGILDMGYSGTADPNNAVTNTFAYFGNGNKNVSGSASSYGSSYTSGDIIGIAMDLDNNKLYFSKNGTWQNSGVPTSGSTGTGAIPTIAGVTYGFMTSDYNNKVCQLNTGNGYFGTTAVTSAGANASGNGIFEYDVPTGYTALSTKGLDS
jgi:hypothetical protein|tara:strand:- start:294 stop:1616 length:1323 start_codon:yes stop_codon:yes gene_type:complete